VGRLFGELEKLGMADDTLVLFTADHGNILGDRGRWFKGIQYEGSARVPLLWRAPKSAGLSGGRVVTKTVENTDLAPSILETVGVPLPEGMQGQSFLKLAKGKDPQWKDRCYSQLRSGMLLDGQWKMIDNRLDGSGDDIELYDLRNDPKEERNQAREPKQRDRVKALRSDLGKWRGERPAPVRVAGMSTPRYAEISETERREALRVAPDAAAGQRKR